MDDLPGSGKEVGSPGHERQVVYSQANYGLCFNRGKMIKFLQTSGNLPNFSVSGGPRMEFCI